MDGILGTHGHVPGYPTRALGLQPNWGANFQETPAVYTAHRMSESHSLPKARFYGALGMAAGAAAGLFGDWSMLTTTLVGGAAGAALGAFLGRSREELVPVAGRLKKGPISPSFAPHNQDGRAIDLLTAGERDLSPLLLPEPAKIRGLDDIRQLPEFRVKAASRTEMLQRLKTQPLEVLVIGGGATGTGTALEASRRGLSVGLIKAYDFSSGTSSKSTKLIHGGVRYLEKAVKKLDKDQYELVKEGVEERGAFLQMAPHLTDEVRLVTPLYLGSGGGPVALAANDTRPCR